MPPDMVSESERLTKLFVRIKQTQDGLDLLDYFKTLAFDNYRAFKVCHHDFDEYHKGYANAIDKVVECFEKCEQVLVNIETQREANKEDGAESPWS